jgi:hypothetical protein
MMRRIRGIEIEHQEILGSDCGGREITLVEKSYMENVWVLTLDGLGMSVSYLVIGMDRLRLRWHCVR